MINKRPVVGLYGESVFEKKERWSGWEVAAEGDRMETHGMFD